MTEEKPRNKNQKAKANDEISLHEPIIQDRIAGCTIMELATRHNMHRNSIANILSQHEDRIKEERQAYLDDRQEQINTALERDVSALAELIGESSAVLKLVLSQCKAVLQDKEKPISANQLVSIGEIAVKAFDRVHSTALNQQKEADKNA